jgi:SAM-dependent methyltransferase
MSWLKHNLYGVDISQLNQEIASSKGYKILGRTSEDIINSTNLFDLIILVDVLEHLPNPDKEIGIIYELLKPGGHLILQVPYKENLSGYLSSGYPFKYVHLWIFDEHNLEILLTRRNHFVLINTTYTAFIGSLPAFLKSNPYSLLSKITSKLYIYLSKTSIKLYKSISRRCNQPIEIIMVLKKN